MQLRYTQEELLMTDTVSEPLLAGGRRCHGGFDADGRYVSPRTRFRVPAIQAWQAQHQKDFGTEILDVPLSTWPDHYPNLAQARFLLSKGVHEPLIATLTRIGTVEGFGANIRHLPANDLQRFFAESIADTATAHLGQGLFEAHGRDEAGHEDEAGHQDMWFAARDIVFEGRSASVDLEAMLQRLGLRQGGSGSGAVHRQLPADIPFEIERIAALMIRVLLIEISAFHTFAWAERWMADDALAAGDGAAARLVSHIRADESPHVAYLRTSLTEMRDRTWVGESGRHYSGSEMIGTLWDAALMQSLGSNRDSARANIHSEVAYWCRQRPDGEVLLETFDSLTDAD
jgi:hypothetical protein